MQFCLIRDYNGISVKYPAIGSFTAAQSLL
jgi:hypothetical protein